MKIMFPKKLGLALGAALCITSAAFGTPSTLQFISANNGSVANLVAASPYTMSLNGGASVTMYCDDWVDSVVPNQEWYVQGTALQNVAGSNVYYQNDSTIGGVAYDDGQAPIDYVQKVKYVAAVWLATNLQGTLPANVRADYSLALWDIFNPLTVDPNNSQTPNDVIDNLLSAADATAVRQDVYNAFFFALNNYSGNGVVNGYTATIYTPLQSTGGGYNIPGETYGSGIATTGSKPQEFIGLTSVPEPSTWAFLGFDFVGAGIAGLCFYRRKSRVRS